MAVFLSYLRRNPSVLFMHLPWHYHAKACSQGLSHFVFNEAENRKAKCVPQGLASLWGFKLWLLLLLLLFLSNIKTFFSSVQLPFYVSRLLLRSFFYFSVRDDICWDESQLHKQRCSGHDWFDGRRICWTVLSPIRSRQHDTALSAFERDRERVSMNKPCA